MWGDLREEHTARTDRSSPAPKNIAQSVLMRSYPVRLGSRRRPWVRPYTKQGQKNPFRPVGRIYELALCPIAVVDGF